MSRTAQAEILRSKTMITVGEMAAGAAHEMNNPLAVISGRSQLLKDQPTIVDLLSGFRVLDTELEHIYFGCDLARRWARWYVVAERAPA